jgi:Transglycosylase SLT domain.
LIATVALMGGTGATAANAATPAAATAREATATAAQATVTVTTAARKKRKASRKARNKAIARPMVRARGWSSVQFGCLSRLWTRESNWNHRAVNPVSGAYGIPQALPARKMASAGGDWRTNPKTQIKWGLKYIKARYGTPCAAWAHARSRGWY